MALSRITISTPTIRHWFDPINEAHDYTEQIKPANFMLVAHPHAISATQASPIALYESDPRQWHESPWIDRRTGERITVTTERFDGYSRPGIVHVRTYRDVIAAYVAHPEAKSLAPDGSPCRANTRGLLQHRPVRGVLPAHYIGKEANRIDDRTHGLLEDVDEYRTEYVDPTDRAWHELVVPVLRTIPRAELAERSGLHRRSIERLLLRGVQPHSGNRERLIDLALECATKVLDERGMSAPRQTEALLHRCLATIAAAETQ